MRARYYRLPQFLQLVCGKIAKNWHRKKSADFSVYLLGGRISIGFVADTASLAARNAAQIELG